MASELSKDKANHPNVFLFIPNLIGYARVLFMVIACYLMPTDPMGCMVFYSISCLLDAIDGHAARKWNQCSQFGAVLDMVTDRSTTSCLLGYLCYAYPKYIFAFQMLIALDLSSHYMQMNSSLQCGSTSHKQVNASENILLRLYYTRRDVLFIVCAGNELFYIALYLLSFSSNTIQFYGWIWKGLCILSFPIWAFKQNINIIQLCGASQKLVQKDIEQRKQTSKGH